MASSKNKKGLGRGIDAIFSEFEAIDENSETVVDLAIDDIRPNPYQPRKTFEEHALNELAHSIEQNGVFQPIIVRESVNGFEIIAGERRYRASKIAKKTTIPAIVRPLSESGMMEIAVLENLQREDLTAIEEAEAYRLLMQKLDLTQERLGERLGKSRAYIANTMRLLQLPRSVQDDIENGVISVGHGKVLAGLKDEELILKFTNIIKEKQISVRELEDLVKQVGTAQAEEDKKTKREVNPHLEYVESNLKSYFGTKVKLKEKNGKGQIIIDYMTMDDLNRLLEKMGLE